MIMTSTTKPHQATLQRRQASWIRTNYLLRTGSFGMSFVALLLELWGRASPATWIPLALMFLVYPHVATVVTRRAVEPLPVEYRLITLDALLIGMAVAALHFPLWLTFTLWLGSALNSAIFDGARGLLHATIALMLGALISIAAFGFRLLPDQGWASTLLLIVGMSAYLLAIGLASHARTQQMRLAREKLRLGEQALSESNERLQNQLSENNRLQAQLAEQAIRDPLTGLFNRRYLETIGPRELSRCERDGSGLALMMIDIDHFKSINDRYGHLGGDEVLKALAAILINSVRGTDIACRFGGEEFLLLLPNMGAQGATDRAEQWRAAFEAMTVESNGDQIKATLSIGVALHPRDGNVIEALTRAADSALYRAKAEGRNRVVLVTPEQPKVPAGAQATTAQ